MKSAFLSCRFPFPAKDTKSSKTTAAKPFRKSSNRSTIVLKTSGLKEYKVEYRRVYLDRYADASAKIVLQGLQEEFSFLMTSSMKGNVAFSVM